MGHTTIRTRENRTLTSDFRDEATYCRLIGDGKAFVAWVLAFVLTLGFQLKHRATCRGGGCLTRHCVDHVTAAAGPANGERVRRWFQAKKAGWYAVLTDPQMPMTSTLLNQAHNTVERKLFAMKGFHHPGGSQRAFLTGLAHLYNLVPYQRRAQHTGQGGIEVEGGHLPTADWFFNLQILTSGGFR